MSTYTDYSNTANATTPDVTATTVGRVPFLKCYWHQPVVMLAARVNMPAGISYPIMDITYDSVTTGAYTDAQAGMMFTLGSTAGGDDYGRGRLRANPTATVLKINRSSQGYNDGEVNVVDNAYITVYESYRVWSKIPYITPAGVSYKDSDIPVGTNTSEPPPVANAGPGVARTADSVTNLFRFYFTAVNSFAVAEGATITGYSWDIKDGSYALGTGATDDDIYADFPIGFRYVALTVTDSNGKTHSTRVPVLVDDPVEADSLCIPGFQLTQLNITAEGQRATLNLPRNLARADYMDGELVMLWQDLPAALYGTPTPQGRDHMMLIGWHDEERLALRAGETHLTRETTAEIIDVGRRLDTLPGFAQVLELPEEAEPLTWELMENPTMDRYIHYLLHWHSTALEVTDYYASGTGSSYPFVIFESDGASLWEQVARKARQFVPDHQLTCDRLGTLRVIVDPMLQETEDRTATIQGIFIDQNWSRLDLAYRRHPRVHVVNASALLTQAAWEYDGAGAEVLHTAFSIAPGHAFGQGVQETTQGEQLAPSQEMLNKVTGHRYARLNSRYGLITIQAPGGDDQGIDPADMTWVTLGVTAESNPQRELGFTSVRCLPKEVNITYRYGEEATVQEATITMEVETSGLPGLTVEFDDAVPVGETPPPPVAVPITDPDIGLEAGQNLVAGVSQYHFYVTNNFLNASPTWARKDFAATTADKILSWVVDPFSPGYILQNGTGAINGWVVTHDKIWRVEDIFGTFTKTAVHTFPVDAAGATHWRTIRASFGAYFAEGINPWLVVVSYYGNTSGHQGTWATRSVDGGVTWSTETLISSGYDSGISAPLPIGLYASPRTPGYALAAAFAPAADSDFIVAQRPAGGDLASLGTLNPIVTGAQVTAVGGQDLTQEFFIALLPPPNTRRITYTVAWNAGRSHDPVLYGNGGSVNLQVGHNIDEMTKTGASDFSAPARNDTSMGGFQIVVNLTDYLTEDWPLNSSNWTPSSNHAATVWIRCYVRAYQVVSGVSSSTLDVTITVDEIMYDDGSTEVPAAGAGTNPATGQGYQSTDWGSAWAQVADADVIEAEHGLAGAIHLPWQDNATENVIYHGALNRTTNREFKLKRVVSGVDSEIGPSSGGRQYGVNHGYFSVRAHDLNRQNVLLAGIANDTTADASGDYVGVWKSANAGDTWTQLVTPALASTTLRGLFAAYGADTEDVIYVWGGYTNQSNVILFATDGSTLNDKQGNLDALVEGTYGEISFLGIAGGPIGGA